MKRILLLTLSLLSLVSCSKFDDSAIWQELENHEERIAGLEKLCDEFNMNIMSLQTIVAALQDKDYVTSVTRLTDDGKDVGYVIEFSKSGAVTIYNGADGRDGKDAVAPMIGVKAGADGVYYWTLNGDWILDEYGKMIPAIGRDGSDGNPGTDGSDGITPELEIRDGFWYVSYDSGETWEQLGKATGEDGKDGADGADGVSGDAFFSSVTQDENNVYLHLADGTVLTLPLASSYLFNKIQSICYVPRYSDGAATVMYGESGDGIVEMDFEIYPKNAVEDIYRDWQKLLSLKAVYTKTRSSVDFIDMPIISCSVDVSDGLLTIIAQGENLSEDFYNGIHGASARLSVSDESNSISSAYIPMIAERTRPGGREIWYTTSDGQVLQPKDPSAIDATIVSNVYENNIGVISFDKDITVIGTTAFNSLSRLTSVVFPDSVVEIGWLAFNNCPNLTTISLPKNLERIGDRAFSLCTDLVDLVLPSKLKSIGKNAFASCSSLTSVHLPESLEELGDAVFYNCGNLSSFTGKFVYENGKCIIYDETLNSISVPGLTMFTVPDNVKHIGYECFRSFPLRIITLNDRIESVGVRAFFMSSISELRFPATLKEVRSLAFSSSQLERCYIEAVTPPAAVVPEGFSSWDAFSNIDDIVIYVPENSVEAYKTAAGWSRYADKIQGMAF